MGRRKSKVQKSTDDKEINAPMLTRNTILKHQCESINSVLNNPLLMDKIIQYSIYKSIGKGIDRKNVSAIRLVSKSWLQSTSRMLKQSSDSVIMISFGVTPGRYCLNGQTGGFENPPKILNRFVSVFSQKSRFPDSILSVDLSLRPYNFIKENSMGTNDFLEHCSDMILELSVHIQSDGVSRIIKCDHINFNILRGLSFYFDKPSKRAPVEKNNYKGWEFLQEVLLNAKKLQNFTLITDDDQGAAVNTASLCSLPESIKRIALCTPLTANQMMLLTKNKLPNLEDIDLSIYGTVREEQLVSKILEHFQSQLKKFSFCISKSNDDNRDAPDLIKFPFMNKLTWLTVEGNMSNVVPQVKADWPKLVPNLNHFTFTDLTESIFMDWTQGLIFNNLEKLKIHLYKDVGDYERDTCSPNLHTMQELHASFPRIQNLTLNFNVNELSGLPILFQKLTTLKLLKLSFHGETDSSTGCKLVSSFLGISLELANILTQKKKILSADSPDSQESITNLKELTLLSLWIENTTQTRRGEDFFFSSVLSKCGFEKMPKLLTTLLLGGFRPIMKHDG